MPVFMTENIFRILNKLCNVTTIMASTTNISLRNLQFNSVLDITLQESMTYDLTIQFIIIFNMISLVG